MTEKEAEGLAVQLARIWQPEQPVTMAPWGIEDEQKGTTWLIELKLRDGLELEVYTSKGGKAPSLRLTRWIGGQQDRAFLLALEEDSDWQIRESELWEDEMRLLTLFRRGCWLCGCPIEATAREKAQWMQSVNPEESADWELKR